MDAVELADRHLKFSQVEVGDALLEDTNEEVVGELILVGKAGDGDGIKAAQESMVGFVAVSNGGERIVAELIVVAEGAVRSHASGGVGEVGLVLLVQKVGLPNQASRNRLVY